MGKTKIKIQFFTCDFLPSGNSCDFEMDTCGWKDSYKESLDWMRGSGDQTENLNTGPTTDHTLQTDLGIVVLYHCGTVP